MQLSTDTKETTMEFVDEIPRPGSGRSSEDIAKLKENPGKWGIVASSTNGDTLTYNTEQRLRMYVRSHDLPVEIGRRTSEGVTRVYASWEPDAPLDEGNLIE